MKDFIKKILRENRVNGEKDLTDYLESLKKSVEKNIKKAYREVTNQDIEIPPINIVIDDDIVDGKIAGFNHAKNGEKAVMGIKSKALKDKEYLKWIITHELIHSLVGEDLHSNKEHGGLFKKIADKVGLPKEFQD